MARVADPFRFTDLARRLFPRLLEAPRMLRNGKLPCGVGVRESKQARMLNEANSGVSLRNCREFCSR